MNTIAPRNNRAHFIALFEKLPADASAKDFANVISDMEYDEYASLVGLTWGLASIDNLIWGHDHCYQQLTPHARIRAMLANVPEDRSAT